jgi:hypothetical protein
VALVQVALLMVSTMFEGRPIQFPRTLASKLVCSQLQCRYQQHQVLQCTTSSNGHHMHMLVDSQHQQWSPGSACADQLSLQRQQQLNNDIKTRPTQQKLTQVLHKHFTPIRDSFTNMQRPITEACTQ